MFVAPSIRSTEKESQGMANWRRATMLELTSDRSTSQHGTHAPTTIHTNVRWWADGRFFFLAKSLWLLNIGVPEPLSGVLFAVCNAWGHITTFHGSSFVGSKAWQDAQLQCKLCATCSAAPTSSNDGCRYRFLFRLLFSFQKTPPNSKLLTSHHRNIKYSKWRMHGALNVGK